MDPQQSVAPGVAQMPPPSIQWRQHADGTWGWLDTTGGRTWDAIGNAYQVQTAPLQPAPQAGSPYVAPGAPVQQQPTPAVAAQQQVANPLVDWFKTHSGTNINAYNFGKLKKSTQELTLAAAEAAGHDKGDVLEDIQKTLPTATGPRRGYVAPLGRR